ncbi:MAG: Arm DNA-binding domain-containing protein, partial [Desulfohalobiaceae bacterium]
MKLSDAKLKGLKPKSSVYRIADGEVNCLSLEVRTSGAKLWRLRFKKPDGKYSMISLGEYPEVSLAK